MLIQFPKNIHDRIDKFYLCSYQFRSNIGHEFFERFYILPCIIDIVPYKPINLEEWELNEAYVFMVFIIFIELPLNKNALNINTYYNESNSSRETRK